MNTPNPDDHAPPSVLEELTSAFNERTAAPAYDFDDPNIDRLLGIDAPTDDAPTGDAPTDDVPADEHPDHSADGTDTRLPVTAGHTAPVGAAEPTPNGADAGRKKTIVIEETDLPDAVYLDEAAEQRLREIHGDPHADNGPPRIVIGDADTAPLAEAPRVTSKPAIDPRVRARRIAVGRARGRKRLYLVGGLLIAVGLVVGTLAVLGSSMFGVEDVTVQGAVNSKQQVAQILDKVRGTPVLLVDEVDLRRKLEALPWVERASVEANFPHALVVDIRERVPVVYFTGTDKRYRLIDRDGKVLVVLSAAPAKFLAITGTAPDLTAGAAAGPLYAGAAELVLSMPTEIRSVTTSVGVNASTGELSMSLKSGATVRIGPPADLTRKLARLLLMIRQKQVSKKVTVDVTTDNVSVG